MGVKDELGIRFIRTLHLSPLRPLPHTPGQDPHEISNRQTDRTAAAVSGLASSPQVFVKKMTMAVQLSTLWRLSAVSTIDLAASRPLSGPVPANETEMSPTSCS